MGCVHRYCTYGISNRELDEVSVRITSPACKQTKTSQKLQQSLAKFLLFQILIVKPVANLKAGTPNPAIEILGRAPQVEALLRPARI